MLNDDRIDEAARSLTEGGPGADLRVRVLARIEQTPNRRTAVRAWLLASAAVAAVAVATVVYRPQAPGSTPSEAAPTSAAVLATSTPGQPADSQGTTSRSALEPEMIVISPIEVAELPATTPIVVEELTVEPILMGAIDLPVPGTVNR